MRYPAPDVIAAGQGRRLAIECKACAGDVQYLTPDDIEQVRAFAAFLEADPWIAVRYTRSDWEFFHPDILKTGGALAARKGSGLPFHAILGVRKTL